MGERTLVNMFRERVAQSSGNTALRIRRDGAWVGITWQQWQYAVHVFARHLQHLGVQKGDRILLLSKNRIEWLVADIAAMYVGAVVVPIHPDTIAKHCVWIAREADAAWAIVENNRQLLKFIEQEECWNQIRAFMRFEHGYDQVSTSEDAIAADTERRIRALEPRYRERIENVDIHASLYASPEQQTKTSDDVWPRMHSDDLATIVYSSGTTGAPRGVCLTHGNLYAEAIGNARALPLTDQDRQLLMLPLSQMYARAIYLTSVLVGCEMSISEGVHHLTREFREERPSFFVGVPTIFEKFSNQAVLDRTSRRVFNPERLGSMAQLARKRARARLGVGSLSLADRAALAIADRTLFKELRNGFGGRLRFAISGGAPVSRFLVEALSGMDIQILEGYGMTETAGAVAVNTPTDWKIGTVGKPLRGIDVKIDGYGEIWIRGPIVFTGYWRDEEATQAVMQDGWFRTGDIGAMVDGRLMITDRAADMIVLGSGKSVSPQRIEARLQSIPVIRYAVITSTENDDLVALLTMDSRLLRAWAHSQGLPADRSYEELCMHQGVFEEVQKRIENVNQELRSGEQVARFAIIPRKFSTETGELTTTNRVRRRFVLEKYHQALKGLATMA